MDNIDKMQMFVGKICTVLTAPVSIEFHNFEQHAQYFTGEITAVDEWGVWLQHPYAKTMSYYPFPIIGIVEEQYVASDDPMADKIKEEFGKKETKKTTPTPPKPQGNFIPVSELSKIVKKKG